MTFLHWAFEPEQVHRLLPKGLEADTFEGRAWVSLTPFLVERFRLPVLPPVPGLSRFPETNVRTYVRGPDGKDGLWFLSLEADSLPTVIGARAGYWVPYQWADMSVDAGPPVRYRSRRRQGGQGHDIVVRPGSRRAEAEVSDLEHWLTGRWRAYTKMAGKLATVPVHHEPWPLQEAMVERLEEDLLAAAGLRRPDDEPLVQFSAGVDAALGPPRPL